MQCQFWYIETAWSTGTEITFRNIAMSSIELVQLLMMKCCDCLSADREGRYRHVGRVGASGRMSYPWHEISRHAGTAAEIPAE